VQEICNENGFTLKSEVYATIYIIDILIPEKKLAIEVEGVQHYTWGGDRLRPKTVAKERYLRELGYNVVHIDARDSLRINDDVLYRSTIRS